MFSVYISTRHFMDGLFMCMFYDWFHLKCACFQFLLLFCTPNVAPKRHLTLNISKEEYQSKSQPMKRSKNEWLHEGNRWEPALAEDLSAVCRLHTCGLMLIFLAALAFSQLMSISQSKWPMLHTMESSFMFSKWLKRGSWGRIYL